MMAALEPSGEARVRAKNRRLVLFFAAVLIAGILAGVYLGRVGGRDLWTSDAPWPLSAVIVVAIGYVGCLVIGNRVLRPQMDELIIHNRLRAMAFASTTYMLVYPLWWLGWKAALVVEPIHWVLFLLFYAAFLVGCGWYANKTN